MISIQKLLAVAIVSIAFSYASAQGQVNSQSQCDSLQQAYYKDKVFIIAQDSTITYLKTSYLQCDIERVSSENGRRIAEATISGLTIQNSKLKRQRLLWGLYGAGGGIAVGLLIGILAVK